MGGNACTAPERGYALYECMHCAGLLQDCEFTVTGCGMRVSGVGTAVRAALCTFKDLRDTAAVAEHGAIMSMQARTPNPPVSLRPCTSFY